MDQHPPLRVGIRVVRFLRDPIEVVLLVQYLPFEPLGICASRAHGEHELHSGGHCGIENVCVDQHVVPIEARLLRTVGIDPAHARRQVEEDTRPNVAEQLGRDTGIPEIVLAPDRDCLVAG